MVRRSAAMAVWAWAVSHSMASSWETLATRSQKRSTAWNVTIHPRWRRGAVGSAGRGSVIAALLVGVEDRHGDGHEAQREERRVMAAEGHAEHAEEQEQGGQVVGHHRSPPAICRSHAASTSRAAAMR